MLTAEQIKTLEDLGFKLQMYGDDFCRYYKKYTYESYLSYSNCLGLSGNVHSIDVDAVSDLAKLREKGIV